ncbi:MAG TPA: type II toxin-antitoxin system HicA family toxin [Tepidisphaeraceae bacterium]|nr:type II toxin-antitoxin system HicA family toxin [Tepidisphaeraceae bacterium]
MIRGIEDDGLYYVGSTGGHRQYKHPVKPGKVTIPAKQSADIPPGTASSILRQAGLK